LRRLLLLAVLVAAGCGGDGGGSSTEQDAKLEAMMLRLADLPEGFGYGDDRGCGEVGTTEGQEPELDEFLIETRPELCSGHFGRAWGGEPGSVQTAIYRFRTEDEARRGWELRTTLFGAYSGIFITNERPNDEGIAFDSKGLNAPGAGEVWQDGRLVVAVYEEGLNGAEGRGFARDLAEKQRRRIESPSVPDEREEDDRTVALDDPDLPLPVYWLGERYEPGGGLPSLDLASASNVGAPGNGPGNELKLDYGGEGGTVNVDVWEPERWRRVKATRFGRLIWSVPCARRSELDVSGGRAEIYGGYSKGCGGEPDHWLAHVYLDGAVVTVNMAYCYACGGRSRTDPYNSRQGMEAVAHGLRRRAG